MNLLAIGGFVLIDDIFTLELGVCKHLSIEIYYFGSNDLQAAMLKFELLCIGKFLVLDWLLRILPPGLIDHSLF